MSGFKVQARHISFIFRFFNLLYFFSLLWCVYATNIESTSSQDKQKEKIHTHTAYKQCHSKLTETKCNNSSFYCYYLYLRCTHIGMML